MACLQPYNDLHLLFEKLVYQPLLISQHDLSNVTLEVSTLYDLITFTPAPPIAIKDFMKVSEHFKLLKDTQYRLQPPPKSHYRNHETLLNGSLVRPCLQSLAWSGPEVCNP
jgi:hypothetical protein